MAFQGEREWRKRNDNSLRRCYVSESLGGTSRLERRPTVHVGKYLCRLGSDFV